MRRARRASSSAVLILLAASGACGGKDGAMHEGAWEFKVDSASQAVWLRGTGKEGPQGKDRTVASILSFDCRSDHTGATIITDQALRQGTTEVELSLDVGPADTLEAFAGTTQTGGQVVLTAPLDSALGLFRGHDSATVDYADGAGSSKTTAVFPLDGLESFRERFLAACGPKKTAAPE